MLEHIGILTFADDAPADLGSRLSEAFATLVGEIPGLLSVRSRVDLGLREGNGSFVFQMMFESADAWQGYFPHPAHQAISQELVMPHTVAKTFVQVSPASDS